MKPGDHPDFFRLAPPEGRSRESTIRLDGEGRFFHEGERVEHPGLEAAMHTWIARHPDDKRFILTNGYDWTYFTVEDVPFFVRSVRVEPERVVLRLSDGSEEAWDAEKTRLSGDRIYTAVKGGAFDARFDRHAQNALGPILEETPDGRFAVKIGSRLVVLS
ncbi:MAG TPA: hypothetical protein VH054_11305 [Polyangiaceae bacterium]|nr:hypothetical protein [Polyangiaceae bacterium]